MKTLQKTSFLFRNTTPKFFSFHRYTFASQESPPLFAWMKKKTAETQENIIQNTSKETKNNSETLKNNISTIGSKNEDSKDQHPKKQKQLDSYFAPLKVDDLKDDLPLKLKQDISRSNYVQNILEIYQMNKGVFTSNNLIFLIKRLSKLFSKLMDNIEALHKNNSMQELMQKVKESIVDMNADSLINTMIFFRKLTDRKYFSEQISREDLENLVFRFKVLVDNRQMTFNEAVLFYYESCYLRLTTAAAFKCIDEILRFEETQKMVNSYYLTILMKALLMNKDFKKSEFFWKNLLEVVNYQIEILKDVNILSQFFDFLIQLDFQNQFSQNPELFPLLQRCCSNLMMIFNENLKLFVNFDLLIILKGYSIAPEWLDRDLLKKISNLIIENFDNSSLYDLDFRLKFLEYMGKTKELDDKTAQIILEKLLRNLKTIEITKPSLFHQIIKSCQAYKTPEKLKIYEYVYEYMNNINLNYNNALHFILITKKFLDDNFECKKTLQNLIIFYQDNIKHTYLERLSLIWDVAFHPSLIEDDSLTPFRNKILEVLLLKVKEKKILIYKTIDIFGDRMKSLAKTQVFMEDFLKQLQETLKPLINDKSSTIVENIKYELFFNSEITEAASIANVLQKGKFGNKKLTTKDLEMLLKFFRSKQVKTIPNFELLIRAVSNSDSLALQKNLSLILNVVCELPNDFLLKIPGKITWFLRNVFEKLPRKLDFKEIGLSYQSFLDLSDFFDKNGLFEFHYHGVLLAQEIINTKLIEEASLYKISEIGVVIASGIKRAEFQNMLKEDHAILIEALRKIAGLIEGNILDDSENADKLKIFKQTVLLCRFLKIYYKAFLADLKSKDPVFVNHSLEKVRKYFQTFNIYHFYKAFGELCFAMCRAE